jgi:uncharacterized protein YndB with AHSA1/START domain
VEACLRAAGVKRTRELAALVLTVTNVSFEPKRRLALSAMAPEQFPTVRRGGTMAVFEFESVSPKETRVTLSQTGWKTGPEWDDAYEYLARGNAILLRQLHRHFRSGPTDWYKLK